MVTYLKDDAGKFSGSIGKGKTRTPDTSRAPLSAPQQNAIRTALFTNNYPPLRDYVIKTFPTATSVDMRDVPKMGLVLWSVHDSDNKELWGYNGRSDIFQTRGWALSKALGKNIGSMETIHLPNRDYTLHRLKLLTKKEYKNLLQPGTTTQNLVEETPDF